MKKENCVKQFLSCMLVVFLVYGVCITSSAKSTAAGPGFGEYEHVFIIGVDGAGAAFGITDTPYFDSIFSEYAFRYDASAEDVTISAQNWGSILTGVPYNVHGFTNNSIAATEHDSNTGAHTIFYYARQAFPAAKLASFVNWQPLNYGLVENDLNVEKRAFPDNDPALTAALEAYFAAGNAPKLLFAVLDNPDHIAHKYGGFSDRYYEAVSEADAQIGRIHDAIEAQGLMENSLFIVVADHGETAGGHGGQSPEELSVTVAAVGHNVKQMKLPDGARNRDVAAIALYALGIEQPADFECFDPQVLFGEERWIITPPETPGVPDEPDAPEQPPAPCKWCGEIHSGLFQQIVGFFHSILYFFAHLFGRR